MKEEKRLFSIGEMAKAVGITRKIILNYESKGLIVPDKKYGDTGNRYYSIDTFTKIHVIRIFQNLGLSLDEIREYFDDTVDLLPLIKRLEVMRDYLNMSIEKLYERANMHNDVIKEIDVAPQVVYVRTGSEVSVEERTVALRDTALAAMRAHGTDTTRRMYFVEYSLADDKTIDYCIAVPSDSEDEQVVTLPACRAIAFCHHGAYEDIPTAREKLVRYAEENGLKLTGRCRHVYIEGPPHHKDKSKFITQVLLLLAE